MFALKEKTTKGDNQKMNKMRASPMKMTAKKTNLLLLTICLRVRSSEFSKKTRKTLRCSFRS